MMGLERRNPGVRLRPDETLSMRADGAIRQSSAEKRCELFTDESRRAVCVRDRVGDARKDSHIT